MSAPSLCVSHRTVGHAVVVRAVGEIDMATGPDLRSNLKQAYGLLPPGWTLVVDLDGVSFLGSVGLSVLFEINERCQATGNPMRVVVSRPEVVRPLQVTGLDRVISVTDSLDRVVDWA